MQAIDVTIPAPAERGRTAKIAAVATAVTALVLGLVGAIALGANLLRDGEGYFTSPSETFTTGSYAITTSTTDVSDAPQWAFGDAGLDTVRVEAQSERPLFIGIAGAGELERYLAGIEHDEVSELAYGGVAYDHADGGAPPRPPADESFWVESTSGAGNLALAWEPQPGEWRAVVMNADGSRGITAELRFGARTSLLWWVGAGLLGAALLATAAAGVLYALARAGR
jgi:hypothetical protein